MKRKVYAILAAVLGLCMLLAACEHGGENNLSDTKLDAATVERVRQELNIPETVSTDEKLPLPKTAGGVAISWKSGNDAVIKDDGTVMRPTGTGETPVTLTATLKKDGKTGSLTFTVTVIHAGEEITDTRAVELAGQNLKVKPSVTEGEAVTLPKKGEGGVAIKWQSFDALINADSGAVGMLADGWKTAAPKKVRLEATLTKGTASKLQAFDVTVYPSDETLVAYAREKLAIETNITGDEALHLPAEVELPFGQGRVNVVWESGNAAVITDSGAVKRPEMAGGPTTVTLTATLSRGQKSGKKEIAVTVTHKVADAADKAIVEKAKKALTLSETEINADKKIALPSEWISGADKVQVRWSSDRRDIIADDGTVTRPSGTGFTQVTLTATLSKGGAAAKKPFTVKVAFKEGKTWKAWAKNGFSGSVTLNEAADSLDAFVSAPPVTLWDTGIYRRETFKKSSLYAIRFEMKSDQAEELEFSVHNTADSKDLAFAPLKTSDDWTEKCYLAYVDNKNAGKELSVSIALKKGAVHIRKFQIIDAWVEWEKWQPLSYSAWEIWKQDDLYEKNAFITAYDITKNSIKAYTVIHEDTHTGEYAYNIGYITELHEGKNFISFTNSGFHGLLQIRGNAGKKDIVRCTIPEKPNGSALWFEVDIPKEYANKRLNIQFWPGEEQTPYRRRVIELSDMRVSDSVPMLGKKLTVTRMATVSTSSN